MTSKQIKNTINNTKKSLYKTLIHEINFKKIPYEKLTIEEKEIGEVLYSMIGICRQLDTEVLDAPILTRS